MALGDRFPRPPAQGDAITSVWGRMVVAALWAVRPIAGKGIRISPGPRGCIIEAVAQPGSGGAADSDHPYKGVNASANDVAKARVVFGIANNIVPKIADATTGVLTPMDGTTGSPARPPELATPTAGAVYLVTLWSGPEPKILESAEVKFAAEVPADDETHGHQLLFTVTLNEAGTAIKDIFPGVTHSLRVERMHCSGDDPESPEGTTTYGWAGV